MAFYPQLRSKVTYGISFQQTRRERKTLVPFSKQSSEKRSRRALWGVSQKLLSPPGKLEPFTGFLDCQGLISFALSMCHFSEPVSIYVSFLWALVLNQSALSLENPQLFALGKSVWVWFWLFLSFYHHLFSAPEGMSACSSLTRRPSWLNSSGEGCSGLFSAKLLNGLLSVRNCQESLLE